MTTHSIGATNTPTAMDYSSLATWAAACPANLVTATQSWIGQVYNQGELSVTGSSVAVSSTTNSTFKVVLTAAAGASFMDNANVATNPLRYNATVGAAITGNISYDAIFQTTCDVEISRLQWRCSGGQNFHVLYLSSASGFSYVHECIVQSATARSGGLQCIFFIGTSSSSLVNSLIILETPSGATSNVCVGMNSGGTVENNTIISLNSGNTGINAQYDSLVLNNNAFFGLSATNVFNTGSRGFSISGYNNATDASAFTGTLGSSTSTLTGAVTSVPFTTATFVAVSGITFGAGAGYDYRTLIGSALIDVGSTANGSSIDIIGTSRPLGTATDIGAYELVIPETGTITASLKKLSSSINSKEVYSGTVSASLKKLSTNFSAFDPGSISASLKKLSANVTGQLIDSATVNATLKKLSSNLTGQIPFIGTVAASLKKLSSSFNGAQITSGLQWTLTNSAGGKYAIDPLTGIVRVAGALTAEIDTIVVQVTQGGKAPASQSININVANEIIATNIVFNPNSLTDLASIGTVLGTASTTDGQQYVWSLASNPGGRWAINASTGVVTVATGLIADTDILQIMITFGTKSYMQSFNVVVVAPTVTNISLPVSTVYSNTSAGQQIAQVSVTGTNLGGSTITYSIPAGHSAGGMFAITSDGIFEIGATALSNGSYTIEITASPTGGAPVTQNFNITVQSALSIQILSYPTTASTLGVTWLTGSYTGSAPAAPSAYWTSAAGAATVSGWTASGNSWSCAITNPLTSTGTLNFNIGGVTSGNIAMTTGVADLSPGIHFPSVAMFSQLALANVPVGSYLLRGFANTPIVSISGPDAAAFYIISGALWININGYHQPQSSFAVTLTATDGVTTSHVDVTIGNPSAVGVTIDSNYILDNASLAGFAPGYTVANVSLWGQTHISLFDPAGIFQYDSVSNTIYIANSNFLTSYGSYPVRITTSTSPVVSQNNQSGSNITVHPSGGQATGSLAHPSLSFSSGSNKTFQLGQGVAASGAAGPVTIIMSYTTTFYIGHAIAPILAWAPLINVYNNTPALAIVGTVGYQDDSPLINFGVTSLMTLTVPTNPSPTAYIGVQGNVRLVSTPSVSTPAFLFSVAGSSGTSLISVTIPVTTGTTLSSSNITFTTLPTIDNSMAWLTLSGTIAASPLLVTTMAVSGFSNTPTWSINVLTSADLPDNCQLNFTGEAAEIPRYSFDGTTTTTTTGTSGITLYGAYFSAQTDHVYITCDDGLGTRCTKLIPVVVGAKVGPSINVGPGKTYTTVNALIAAWFANRPAFNGATVTLYPGIDPTTDFNYPNIGAGSKNAWWPGPVTLQSPAGTVRTVLDWQGGNNGSSQSGVVCANFDMTLINLEVCNVSDAGGSGEPNCGGVYMTAGLPGNLTMSGCYIHGCDMGLLNGDTSGRHVVVDSCIFQRNGSPDGSGRCHNIYVSTVSSFTCSNTQSDASTDDHDIKCRAMVTTITNCSLRQGAQAIGSGVPINVPLGGILTISGCTIMTAANPGNGYATESGDEAAPNNPNFIWSPSSTSITNNTFYNLSAPGAIDLGLVAAQAIANYTSVLAVDGSPLITTYSNNQFYNYPAVNWTAETNGRYPSYYSGFTHPIVNGGGNTSLTTYTHQAVIDPLTGTTPIHSPPLGFADSGRQTGFGNSGFQSNNSLQLDFIMATAPSIGTTACTLTPYDQYGNALTGITYTMLNNAGGKFVFGGSGAVNTATGSTPDGLYFVQLQADGTSTTLGAFTTSNWIPIIVGNGFVAAS